MENRAGAMGCLPHMNSFSIQQWLSFFHVKDNRNHRPTAAHGLQGARFQVARYACYE